MKIYGVDVVLHGTCRCKDPNCPLGWEGSGIYDISVDAVQNVSLQVAAECAEDAKLYANEYDFKSDLEDIESVEVLDAGEVAECDDEPGTVVDSYYGKVIISEYD